MSNLSNKDANTDAEQDKDAKQMFRVNARVAFICISFVAGMVGLSYASVPLYRLFCQVTGYGGTTQKAEGFTGTISDTVISVSFDSNISQELDWSFKPKKRAINIRLGEKATAIYLAKNIGKSVSTGEASFNVSPQSAGQYFNKIECFCFTEQTLKPGEMVEMPVLFFVDPDIEKDPLLKNTKIITLSYTFYAQEPDEDEKTTELINKTELNDKKARSEPRSAKLKMDDSSELSKVLQ